MEFIVNFAPEIREIISEAKGLVSLGYSIPDLAQRVALQEDKFIRYSYLEISEFGVSGNRRTK